jgi:AP-3 complex subunit delta-1
MDPDEDSSVTAAIVNVVCELGWRRPHDFLPLAPRLFELLVDGGNNWMAIKLIKLVRRPRTLSFAFPDHVVVCHSHAP